MAGGTGFRTAGLIGLVDGGDLLLVLLICRNKADTWGLLVAGGVLTPELLFAEAG